jgi:hypothetical protein
MQGEVDFASILAKVKAKAHIEQDAKEVGWKYGPMFTPEGIASLDPERFKAFLRFKENRHWISINRHSGELTSDMARLKEALLILIDESRPISERIDDARKLVKGLGKAVISAILIVTFPTKYGVYNDISKAALTRIGIFPGTSNPEWTSLSSGKHYEQVNQILLKLSKEHGISLWSLDFVLGQVAPRSPRRRRTAYPMRSSV